VFQKLRRRVKSTSKLIINLRRVCKEYILDQVLRSMGGAKDYKARHVQSTERVSVCVEYHFFQIIRISRSLSSRSALASARVHLQQHRRFAHRGNDRRGFARPPPRRTGTKSCFHPLQFSPSNSSLHSVLLFISFVGRFILCFLRKKKFVIVKDSLDMKFFVYFTNYFIQLIKN